MSHLQAPISFLLVASFALLFVTVLTSTASKEVFFTRIHGTQDIARITIGMWGACSNVINSGDPNQGITECTSSKAAYSLTLYLPTIPTGGGVPQTQTPFQLDLLRSSDTGPLLCLLLSFLLLIIAMVPWCLDVFRDGNGKRTRVSRISRITCWVLVLLSMVLAWVGFGFAIRLKSQINTGLESYRATGDAARMYQASHGNATWCALAGAITMTVAFVLVSIRWNSLRKKTTDNESLKALRKDSSTA